MDGVCGRCDASIADETAFCEECGLPQRQTSGLPTPEALEAAKREAAWLKANGGGEADPWPTKTVGGPSLPKTLATPDPPPYKSLGWRARLVRTWLVFTMFASAISALLSFVYYSRLTPGSMVGKQFTDPDAAAAQDHFLLWSLFVLVAVLFCTVLWVIWFHRAYKNVASFGHALRFGTGWAIGSWFVPILSLFRPKQIANDIWRGSSPDRDGLYWLHRPVSAIVHWWWAFFLIGGFLERASARAGGTLSAERTSALTGGIADCMFVVAAALALTIVHSVTRMQSERAEPIPAVGNPQPAT